MKNEVKKYYYISGISVKENGDRSYFNRIVETKGTNFIIGKFIEEVKKGFNSDFVAILYKERITKKQSDEAIEYFN